VTIRWKAATGADGYLLRYGIAPDALSQCIQVQNGKTEELTFHALTRGVRYGWRLDAFSDSGVRAGQCIQPEPR
jgi:hypothetical protein